MTEMAGQSVALEATSSAIYIDGVINHLPHRYPFLLIDRVLEVVPGERIRAIKNVTINEPFFTGHFPNEPVMPGVLIIEALAQATGILTTKTTGKPIDAYSTYYLVGVDNARFRKTVQPGDQLVLEATVMRVKRDLWKYAAEAKVDGNTVCNATIMGAFKEHDS